MNIPTVNLFMQIPFSSLENTWAIWDSRRTWFINLQQLWALQQRVYMKWPSLMQVLQTEDFESNLNLLASIKTPNGKIIYKNEELRSEAEVLDKRSTVLLNAMLQKTIVEGTGSSMIK